MRFRRANHISQVAVVANEIARFTELSWDSPAQTENGWFKGTLRQRTAVAPARFPGSDPARHGIGHALPGQSGIRHQASRSEAAACCMLALAASLVSVGAENVGLMPKGRACTP
jgi:hypothetical protein